MPVGTAEAVDLAAATVQQRRRHECTRTCSHSSSTDNGGNATAVVARARARASHRGRGACSRMVVEATPRADLLGVVEWQVVGRATVEMWE